MTNVPNKPGSEPGWQWLGFDKRYRFGVGKAMGLSFGDPTENPPMLVYRDQGNEYKVVAILDPSCSEIVHIAIPDFVFWPWEASERSSSLEDRIKKVYGKPPREGLRLNQSFLLSVIQELQAMLPLAMDYGRFRVASHLGEDSIERLIH